jgi:hypothetical protein
MGPISETIGPTFLPSLAFVRRDDVATVGARGIPSAVTAGSLQKSHLSAVAAQFERAAMRQ